MTKRLEEAMAETQSLPPDEQDFIAAMLLDNIRYARVWIDPTDENPHDEFFDAVESFEPAAGSEMRILDNIDPKPAKKHGMLERFHRASHPAAVDTHTPARLG